MFRALLLRQIDDVDTIYSLEKFLLKSHKRIVDQTVSFFYLTNRLQCYLLKNFFLVFKLKKLNFRVYAKVPSKVMSKK